MQSKINTYKSKARCNEKEIYNLHELLNAETEKNQWECQTKEEDKQDKQIFHIERAKTYGKGKKSHSLKKHNTGNGWKHYKKLSYEAGGKENVNHNIIESNEQKANKEGIIELLSSFEESNYNLQRILNLY